MAHSVGKVVVTNAIAMGKDDVETLQKLVDKGVKFTNRKVPSDSTDTIESLLSKAKAELAKA